MEAFAGIDVAFAKGTALPVSVCVRRAGRLEPLPLKLEGASKPPRGHGNPVALEDAAVRAFADATATYLHQIEQRFGVRIVRLAIDSPSDPKVVGTQRRLAELALDLRRISCITTPDEAQVAAASKWTGCPDPPAAGALATIGYGSRHDQLDAYLAAWVASLDEGQREALGTPPNDVIWVPLLSVA